MSENRKFYWLKLKIDFFKRHDIRIIEEMENGKDYILFYLKLLLESVTHEGQLRFSETIPYNEKMLAVITNTNVDIVRSAMKVLLELKMIEILDDSTIYMSEVLKLTGCDTAEALKKRRQRANKTAQLLQEGTMSRQCPPEIELELEKELEIDIEIEKDNKSDKPTKPIRHKRGRYNNVLLSDEDFEKLQEEFPDDYEERIERLSEYIESKGAKYKNHLATIRCWAKRDKDRVPKETPKSEAKTSGNIFLDLLNRGEV